MTYIVLGTSYGKILPRTSLDCQCSICNGTKVDSFHPGVSKDDSFDIASEIEDCSLVLDANMFPSAHYHSTMICRRDKNRLSADDLPKYVTRLDEDSEGFESCFTYH
jgi:hypothetical protein